MISAQNTGRAGSDFRDIREECRQTRGGDAEPLSHGGSTAVVGKKPRVWAPRGAPESLVLFGRRLRAERFLSAVNQRLPFGVGQAGGRMHRQIEPRWHIALLHFGRDVLGVALGLVPLREIQVAAAAIHVSLQEPRDRSDI